MKNEQRNGLRFPPLSVIVFRLGASQAALGIREDSNNDQQGPGKFNSWKHLLTLRPSKSLSIEPLSFDSSNIATYSRVMQVIE